MVDIYYSGVGILRAAAPGARFLLAIGYEKDESEGLINGFEPANKQAKYLAYARCDMICWRKWRYIRLTPNAI